MRSRNFKFCRPTVFTALRPYLYSVSLVQEDNYINEKRRNSENDILCGAITMNNQEYQTVRSTKVLQVGFSIY